MHRVTIGVGNATNPIAHRALLPTICRQITQHDHAYVIIHEVEIDLTKHPSNYSNDQLAKATAVYAFANVRVFQTELPRNLMIASILEYYSPSEPIQYTVSSFEKSLWFYTPAELWSALTQLIDNLDEVCAGQMIPFTDAVICILERLQISHSIRPTNRDIVAKILRN